MKYIIYSNGSIGYNLYQASEDFPEAYKTEIAKLYSGGTSIATLEDGDGTPRGIRLTPFGDYYLISVIYRGCTGNGETRQMYVGINWLLDYSELEEMLKDNDYEGFMDLLEQSDLIMEKKGYKFTKEIKLAPRLMNEFSHNTKKILVSSVYSSNIDDDEKKLQSFVGYDTITDAYEMLFWIFKNIPAVFWQKMSIYIGAASTKEICGSYLVFMKTSTLRSVANNGRYGNAMPYKKINLLGEDLKGDYYIPEEIGQFLALNQNEIAKVNAIFRHSDDFSAFMQLVALLLKKQIGEISVRQWIDMLGETVVIRCLNDKIFDRDTFLKTIYKNSYDYRDCQNLSQCALVYQNDFKRIEEEKRKEKELKRAEEEKHKEKELKRVEEEKERKRIKEAKKQETKSKNNVSKAVQAYPHEDLPEQAVADKKDNKSGKFSVGYPFSYIERIMRNRGVVCLIVAVLSLLVIVAVDILVFDIAAKLSFDGIKLVLLNKTVSIKVYFLTIIGLNIVNIPVGFTFIASVIELLKMYTDRKRR